MIGILFHYEENRSDVHYGLWDEFLAIWEFDLLIMIDKDSLYSNGKRPHTYKSLQEAMPNYNATYIALAPHGSNDLKEFTHPADDVIYIIGANSWKDSQLPDGITTVKINTPVDSTARSLTDISAAVCLAYDRLCKLG